MKKSRTFNLATCWTLKKIVEFYLPEEKKLRGGYVGVKHRKIRITVIAEKV